MGIKCEFGKQNSLEVAKTLFYEAEGGRHSKQQVRPNNEQKWRSNEPIISSTKMGNYRKNFWLRVRAPNNAQVARL